MAKWHNFQDRATNYISTIATSQVVNLIIFLLFSVVDKMRGLYGYLNMKYAIPSIIGRIPNQPSYY